MRGPVYKFATAIQQTHSHAKGEHLASLLLIKRLSYTQLHGPNKCLNATPATSLFFHNILIWYKDKISFFQNAKKLLFL